MAGRVNPDTTARLRELIDGMVPVRSLGDIYTQRTQEPQAPDIRSFSDKEIRAECVRRGIKLAEPSWWCLDCDAPARSRCGLEYHRQERI